MTEHPVYGILDEGGHRSPSSVYKQGIRICKPYSLRHLRDISQFVEPTEATHSYQRVEDDDWESEAIHIGPNIKSKKVQETLIHQPKPIEEVDTSHIPFENVIDIDKDSVEKVEKDAKQYTSELMEVMFNRHSPLAMAGEVAQSQIVAIFKDCFGIEVEPEIDFENQLDFLSNLDTFCYLLSKQKNIPEKVKNVLIEKSIEKMIVDWSDKTKVTLKQDTIRRYRSSLENASARVTDGDNSKQVSGIGVRGSFNG